MRYLLALVVFALAGSTLAQSVGGPGATDAKQLSRDEVQALLSGATVTFAPPAAPRGTVFSLTYEKNGMITGSISGTQGGTYMVSGKWKVDDAGKYCEDFTTPRGGSSGCFVLRGLGENYFWVAGDGKVFQRKISH